MSKFLKCKKISGLLLLLPQQLLDFKDLTLCFFIVCVVYPRLCNFLLGLGDNSRFSYLDIHLKCDYNYHMILFYYCTN